MTAGELGGGGGGLFHLLINGIYWGYNPLTNLLLTPWDIQVGDGFK